MPYYNLERTIKQLTAIDLREARSIILPAGCCTPGCWTVISTLAYDRSYRMDDIVFASPNQQSYARTLGLDKALNSNSDNELARPNEGNTYSRLVKINNVDSTDTATSTINSCLRKLAPENSHKVGFRALCDVIGELHSNVWDHGLKTAFSTAQRYNVPASRDDDYFFEFSLADSGLGFKREMERTGLTPADDIEAIRWCIQKGNSTKKTGDRDEFSQRLPSDHAGNPFGTNIETFQSDGNENHHQGLGLAKLVDLIKETSGELCLVSGHGVFTINPEGVYNYEHIETSWSGVALSCRFKSSKLFIDEEPASPDIEQIMDVLMEEQDNENYYF